ncbi:hypothetical protein I6N96_18150 [Enterococcus sp. BWM-S5]|uniref:Uncharacterized protein n=1 Tax=Enterococcus larvae TaxID=2794352 RepID=A0ABS4CQ60_9ENTE|nr:hypothetical protein [Enterococcus larvae]MBP1048220.1 hypothetical protein [Enterococcus larvae]
MTINDVDLVIVERFFPYPTLLEPIVLSLYCSLLKDWVLKADFKMYSSEVIISVVW